MNRPSIWRRAVAYSFRVSYYAAMFDCPRVPVEQAWREFSRRSALFVELDRALRQGQLRDTAELGASLRGATRIERCATLWGPSAVNRELYTMVRLLRPQRVVETGVASGISSSVILEALSRNGSGRLWSIDLPNYLESGYLNADSKREAVRVPAGRAPGWLVPERLRSRWTLSLGSSRALLAGLLSELGAIDLFFHDSEHSNETMTFEFHTAWPRLRVGGLLYADDVIWNDAFDRFSREAGEPPELTPAGRGALRKRAG